MEIINEEVRKLVNAAILEHDRRLEEIESQKLRELQLRFRSKNKEYRPDFCVFDAENWADEICQGCEMGGDRCCEDWYSDYCPRHDVVEECELAAFEANERIYRLLS